MAGNLLKRFRKNSTEDEIKQLVDEDENVGELQVSQRRMINNIFRFDDITAGEIMTHRTDIEALSSSASVTDAARMSIENGFSRIPVYDEDLDNITGIIYVKDLLKFVGKPLSGSEKLTDYMRSALFVPESIPCLTLFSKMTEMHIQLAVVIDEYGGTAGIVSMEDILESIVGSIQDEYDDEGAQFKKIDDNNYIFDGITPIEKVEKIINMRLPRGDYDTLAGFFINLLGFLPEGNEPETPAAKYEKLKLTVLNVEDRRIEKIKVEID
ncbi:MAG: hemolysin family protein [Clostridiales bacterium]|nr:hemolysin family protein [Clostridiales bacterium]